MEKKGVDVRTVTVVAIMIAITCVFTLLIRVPIAPTRGYITLADVGVYFAAFAFGPWIGFLAGGVGTGLADAIAGYPHWTILSFIIHGLQGLVAGYIGKGNKVSWMLVGWVAGSVIMVVGYFVAAGILYGWGPAAVEFPGNIIQNVAGGLVGIPLVLAVRKAYPPMEQIGWGKTLSSRK